MPELHGTILKSNTGFFTQEENSPRFIPFYLSEEFVNSYINKKVPWGPVGEFTYMRTYSREYEDQHGKKKKEKWHETVRRVVEGCFTTQKRHCYTHRVPWYNGKAQNSAKIMYDLIFNMKFLPPGRGLWMMGTEYVEERLAACLNNCSFVSSKNIAIDPTGTFRFLMDMSMLGVGVGFDTKGAGQITIKKPNFIKDIAIIPDTREGWVEAMGIVLNGFFTGSEIPKFDYSQIRKKGEAIKGFGGTASGPGPLIEMIDSIIAMLKRQVGNKIKSTTVVDICGMIGKCVVSGNVRRSALIALGDSKDKEFIGMKDYNNFPKELEGWRWASNNSVLCDVGQDYSDIAEKIAVNGEPGIVWLDNAKKFGRMCDPQNDTDYKAEGCNPCCFTGDTLIAVADGRNAVPIKQLVDEGDDVPVYSYTRNGESEISYMRQFQKTGENAQIYKVTLDDETSIRVTGDHKFILSDGSYKKCIDLAPGDSLVPFRSYIRNGRRHVESKPGKTNWYTDIQARRIFKFFNNEIPNKYHIHHIDGSKQNDAYENLRLFFGKDHISFHSSGENNSMYGKNHSEETKMKIGCKTSERMDSQKIVMKKYWNSKEWRAQFKGEELKEWHKGAQKEYFEKAISTGLKAKYNDDGLCIIEKTCDGCDKEFEVPYRRRNACFCTKKCQMIFYNTGEFSSHRIESQKAKFEESQEEKLKLQIKAYNDLKFKFKKDPMKKEWEGYCRENNIPFRLRNPASSTENKFALKSFKHLKELAAVANHRIVSVEKDGFEDVYNGTVDNNHTLGIVSSKLSSDPSKSLTGIYLRQSEQTLESYELCCLVETFPSRHDSYEEYQKTLKYAYLYAKTVTLLSTHWEPTNAVLLRNRRIGTSQSGIIDAFVKHGRQTTLDWARSGYGYLRKLDSIYSDWLCIPRSIKITSVKPSGSVSLLPGVSPGIHYAHSEYYIRRIVVSNNSPLVGIMKDAGYSVVPCYGKEDTAMVVEFPVKTEYFIKGKKEVTMWEQLLNASDYQKYWADNQVSITVTFKEDEARDIPNALSIFDSRLKSVSMLPYADHGYKQAPYEEIDEATYNKMSKDLKKPNYSKFIEAAVGEKYCDGDSCQLSQ